MGSGNNSKGLLPFGVQQMPGNWKRDPLMDFFYSAGSPGVFSTGQDGLQYRSIYQDMMNQNLQNGLPPFTGFPKGFGAGSNDANGDGEPDNGEDKKPNKLRGMPRWYQNWYYNSGKFGGVPPGKGLLDA